MVKQLRLNPLTKEKINKEISMIRNLHPQITDTYIATKDKCKDNVIIYLVNNKKKKNKISIGKIKGKRFIILGECIDDKIYYEKIKIYYDIHINPIRDMYKIVKERELEKTYKEWNKQEKKRLNNAYNNSYIFM